MGSIPVRVIKKLLNLRIEEFFYASRTRNRKNTGRPQAAKKSPVDSFLVFGSHESGMSAVVAVVWAHLRKGVFYQTRTGIATMTTAASGRNRESLLGLWPARRECRLRHEADAGSHNPVQGGGAQRRKQSAQWAVA